MSKYPVYIILHNLRSAYNVGSIFRTADAVGASGVYLSGYTPKPIDNFGRADKKIAKTALGAEKSVPWQYQRSPSHLINKLRSSGVKVVAVEQSNRSIDYRKFKPSSPTAFVFGNEVSGISSATLNNCDQVIEIPMVGQKESLNVSVTVGVILFHFVNS